MTITRTEHWNAAYETKGDRNVSWFEEQPSLSFDIMATLQTPQPPSLIDIGGGASRVADAALKLGWQVSVLDISDAALALSRERLGVDGARVEWIVADITAFQPSHQYDFWHDRAVFHFLTEAPDRAAYATAMRQAVKPGGFAVIATFAPDGPEKCSGLNVQRYSGDELAGAIGDGFSLIKERRFTHRTPWGSEQRFQVSVLKRV